MKFKTICLTILASTTLGISTLNNTNVPSAQAKKLTQSLIYKHYMREYKVKVLKSRPMYELKLNKNGILTGGSRKVTLHKGEVVRTWFREVGGVDWQVTGGKSGKYTSKHKEYSVSWTNTNQFKILHTYSASHAWF